MEKEEIILTGEIQRKELEEYPFSEWFLSGYADYKPDLSIVEDLKKHVDSIKIMAFIGTWCPDCHREYPHLIKILDEIQFPSDNLITYGLDQEKNMPEGRKFQDIEFVPTFLVFKNGRELGRIVERPGAESLEKDVLNIVENP